LSLLLWTLSAAYSGFYLGRTSPCIIRSPLAGVQLELDSKFFTYNRTFSEPPSYDSDQAWNSVFPSNGTFFVHPVVAPTIAVYSAFHQLHCLNGIRHGYWTAYQLAIQGIKLQKNDSVGMGSEAHVRHCLDLLRQTLMCHADTTIEVVDEIKKGASGFGVEHRCGNWAQLKQWTEKWHFKEQL